VVKNTGFSLLANSPLVGQILFATNGMTRMTTSKTYDNLNRLTQISSSPSGYGLSAIGYSYNYNPANQRAKNTLADGSYGCTVTIPSARSTTAANTSPTAPP